MKVGIIGATGKAGKLILDKAVARKLDVTAIVRSPEKLDEDNFEILEKDAGKIDKEVIKKFDVIVNALGFEPEEADKIHEYGSQLIDEADKVSETRFITIGHAGTLFKDEDADERMFKGDSFPEDFKPVAANHYKNLELLKTKENLTWTFMCPASFFDPEGDFTSKYKMQGGEIRIKNSEDKSYLSYKDLASAVVDEVINKNHTNEQVSVVGEKSK